MQLQTLAQFFTSFILILGDTHLRVVASFLATAARDSPTSGARPGILDAPYLPFGRPRRCSGDTLASCAVKPLGPVGRCHVPLPLVCAATSIGPAEHVPSTAPPTANSFSDLHPSMVSDLLAADVVYDLRSRYKHPVRLSLL